MTVPERDMVGSGDNIRRRRIEHRLNLILEHEFAPLQPGHFELIASRFRRQGTDAVVEQAVLGAKSFKRGRGIVVGHPDHDLAQIAVTRNLDSCAITRAATRTSRDKGQDKLHDSCFSVSR